MYLYTHLRHPLVDHIYIFGRVHRVVTYGLFMQKNQSRRDEFVVLSIRHTIPARPSGQLTTHPQNDLYTCVRRLCTFPNNKGRKQAPR